MPSKKAPGASDMPFGEDVAEGVRRGDPDAVGAVYVALADRLLGYVAARVRDVPAAEDVIEATFVELLQNGHTIRGGPRAIKVWLYRAAHFNALDHFRKVSRRAEDLHPDVREFDVAAEDRGPEEVAVADSTRHIVRSAMDELSEDQRQVLLLRYTAELSAPEVARVLGKSHGAIRSLQHRGERALRRLLEGVPDIASDTVATKPTKAAPSAPFWASEQ